MRKMVMHKQTNGRRMIGETGRMYIPGMKAEGAIEAGTPTNVGTIDDTGTVRETRTDTEQSLDEIVIIEATETVATIEIEKGTEIEIENGTGTSIGRRTLKQVGIMIQNVLDVAHLTAAVAAAIQEHVTQK